MFGTQIPFEIRGGGCIKYCHPQMGVNTSFSIVVALCIQTLLCLLLELIPQSEIAINPNP
jgi:hypothetical protein